MWMTDRPGSRSMISSSGKKKSPSPRTMLRMSMCSQLRKKAGECFAVGYRNWNTAVQTNQRLAKTYASQRTYQKDRFPDSSGVSAERRGSVGEAVIGGSVG